MLFTIAGLVGTALATVYVIKTGVAASTDTTKRTVVATIAPMSPAPQNNPAAVTVGPASDERPVRVNLGAAAPQPMVDLRRITYTVAGNQRPDDPVTVVYADETGALRVAENVTLPWTLTVVPTLPVTYVTANSTGSQLNCWITDASGATVVSQTRFSPSTTCNH